ncbi:hypothetical protein J6TS2_48280 [Heyndrickxia sporothermodurans]|nr:hypothetical protein J6TS2_48280 [Heyndrickxia sporothermodurans]
MDKFNFNRNQMITLAQRNLAYNIFNSARLERVNVSLQQINNIIHSKSELDIDKDDLQIILNLHNAWKYILSNPNVEFSLDYACKVNSFVSFKQSLDWGKLRYGSVGIVGVNYKPVIPVERNVRKEINTILSSNESITWKAIMYMLYGMRSQLFWDGNKRTSILCANKLLIQYGKGLITVPEMYLPEFHERLSQFYETNDYSKIYNFIYDKCLYSYEIV